MEPLKKEDKYLVIKREDLRDLRATAESLMNWTSPIPDRGDFFTSDGEKEQTRQELKALDSLLERIDNRNKYIVCNQNEPYADCVWHLILGCEALKRLRVRGEAEQKSAERN